MTGLNLAWDWGVTGNSKLAELFTDEEQKDFFCEYLINEMPIDDLVAYFLFYAPVDTLKVLASDIGAFNIGEN
jgi:hypothetical protein